MVVYMTALLLIGPITVAPRWGGEGHRIVCEIAWQRLTSAGRALVGELLDDESGRAFVGSCSWADAVRRTTHRRTAPLHYVNIPPGAAGFDMTRDCGDPDTRCVTWAVGHYAAALSDRSTKREERAEALKFLAHFVADLHQPLHAGRAADRGGNDVPVSSPPGWECRGDNLHWVWDSSFLCAGGLVWPDSAWGLLDEISPGEIASWRSVDLVAWTDEAYRISEDFAYRLPHSGAIDAAYASRAVMISREQLKKAGVRLAHLINRAVRGQEAG